MQSGSLTFKMYLSDDPNSVKIELRRNSSDQVEAIKPTIFEVGSGFHSRTYEISIALYLCLTHNGSWNLLGSFLGYGSGRQTF